jgi:UDP:flavonoid glycosyltransferase YjiC (YdhE family)
VVDNNTPIHFVVVIVGSKGDLFPLLAVGEEMRRRGHRVTVIAPIIYDHLASKSDLDFIPLSAEEDHRASSKDKVLLNTRYQSLFYLRHAVSWNLAIYQSILRKTNETLVILAVDRPHLWADLVAHSKLRAPVVRFRSTCLSVRSGQAIWQHSHQAASFVISHCGGRWNGADAQ